MDTNVAGQHVEPPALDRRLEGVGWALFLIMIGGIGLLRAVPQGTWLLGTGVIMLGLNIARCVNGLRVSHFSIVLGVAAILLGAGGMTGLDVPFFPVLIIIIGADILFKVATRNP